MSLKIMDWNWNFANWFDWVYIWERLIQINFELEMKVKNLAFENDWERLSLEKDGLKLS